MTLSKSKKGRLIETKAEILFLEAGFEVFTNIAPDGPADLVVWDGQTCYPIDTKKLSEFVRADGSIGYSSKYPQVENVFYLGYYSQGWVWLSDGIPEALNIL